MSLLFCFDLFNLEAMDSRAEAASERILLEPYKYLLQLPGERVCVYKLHVMCLWFTLVQTTGKIHSMMKCGEQLQFTPYWHNQKTWSMFTARTGCNARQHLTTRWLLTELHLVLCWAFGLQSQQPTDITLNCQVSLNYMVFSFIFIGFFTFGPFCHWRCDWLKARTSFG